MRVDTTRITVSRMPRETQPHGSGPGKQQSYSSSANTYMNGLGWTPVSASATGPLKTIRAYAFGTTSSVKHFARNTGYTMVLRNDPIRAKWGHAEVFNHSNANPYKPTPYGPLVGGYVK